MTFLFCVDVTAAAAVTAMIVTMTTPQLAGYPKFVEMQLNNCTRRDCIYACFASLVVNKLLWNIFNHSKLMQHKIHGCHAKIRFTRVSLLLHTASCVRASIKCCFSTAPLPLVRQRTAAERQRAARSAPL